MDWFWTLKNSYFCITYRYSPSVRDEALHICAGFVADIIRLLAERRPLLKRQWQPAWQHPALCMAAGPRAARTGPRRRCPNRRRTRSNAVARVDTRSRARRGTSAGTDVSCRGFWAVCSSLRGYLVRDSAARMGVGIRFWTISRDENENENGRDTSYGLAVESCQASKRGVALLPYVFKIPEGTTGTQLQSSLSSDARLSSDTSSQRDTRHAGDFTTIWSAL